MNDSIIAKNQMTRESRTYSNDDRKIIVTLRFDDSCNNGHDTFSITADMYHRSKLGNWVWDSGGCQHDEIKKWFPEFAHLIKWHFCSTDGPMHYIANTVYHAGDKDHWGLRKGEFRHAKDTKGNLKWQLPRLSNSVIVSSEKPEPIVVEYEPVGIAGEGKERRLDYARDCAIWPDATDEELMSDDLQSKLEARLPQLLREFRTDMENLGFTW